MLAGASATFLGVGMQRFAYSLLLPAMIGAGWLGAGAAGALGAANLGGYLAGALLGPPLGQKFGLIPALRAAMLAAAGSFVLCAVDGGFLWFCFWRVLAGIAGGALMVLAGPAVQAAIAPRWRGLAAGFTFTGVGSGIVFGALAVPLLLHVGLAATWAVLGAAAFLLCAMAWRLWPAVAPAPRRALFSGLRHGASLRLIAAYAMAAVAATPHMLWWPDFITRGLARGTNAGSAFWLLFGVSAAAGPALWGRLADFLGLRWALVLALLAQVIDTALPLFARGLPALSLSTIVAGATATGVSGLFLLCTRSVGGEGAPALWSLATAAYGAAQTLIGFVLACLYATTGSHLPLFEIGLGGAILTLPLAHGLHFPTRD
jgi:predicted MFS family arabinose efflux permease